MELFRLGRLQFEPITLEEEIVHGGRIYPAGTPALSVHIPAGEPLDPDAALDSFRQAEAFFPHYFGQTYPLFYCHSWLMAPSLTEILPASSRIMQFQRMFQLKPLFIRSILRRRNLLSEFQDLKILTLFQKHLLLNRI
jgi:hypothetical protein